MPFANQKKVQAEVCFGPQLKMNEAPNTLWVILLSKMDFRISIGGSEMRPALQVCLIQPQCFTTYVEPKQRRACTSLLSFMHLNDAHI